jgi:hypothetical protein
MSKVFRFRAISFVMYKIIILKFGMVIAYKDDEGDLECLACAKN